MSPFETTVAVRYRDLDPMGHVNNAVYATYLQTARSDFFTTVFDIDVTDADAVVASLSLEFHAPLPGTDPVTVLVWVPEVGNASCTLAYELRRNDRHVADGETVLVMLDEAGDPRPISEQVRGVLTEYQTPPES